jgi:Glycosyltransferase family 87
MGDPVANRSWPVSSKVDSPRLRGSARASLGPLALAVYGATQFAGSYPAGRGNWLWAATLGLALTVAFIWRRRLTTHQIMALEVLTISLVYDYQYSIGGELRDLKLYLHAGSQFLAGGQVYTTVPIHHYPGSDGFLPFLYAPPTLPILGALSALPYWLAAGLWIGSSVAAIVLSLRLFGLSWRWAFLALLWGPIEQGLYVGNVVIPSLLLLAVALRRGGILGLGPMLKPQNGILWLWLVRQRAWRSLAASVLVVIGVIAITLPLTGTRLWGDWISALLAFQQSQQILTGLYGIGLGRWIPVWAYVLIGLAGVAAALLARGRKGLARLGLASVIASPSLWSHGLVFAIPEILRLRGQWFWLAAGLCIGGWPGPQAAIGFIAAGWFVSPLIHRLTERLMPQATIGPTTHPLDSRAAQRPRPAPGAPPTVAGPNGSI